MMAIIDGSIRPFDVRSTTFSDKSNYPSTTSTPSLPFPHNSNLSSSLTIDGTIQHRPEFPGNSTYTASRHAHCNPDINLSPSAIEPLLEDSPSPYQQPNTCINLVSNQASEFIPNQVGTNLMEVFESSGNIGEVIYDEFVPSKPPDPESLILEPCQLSSKSIPQSYKFNSPSTRNTNMSLAIKKCRTKYRASKQPYANVITSKGSGGCQIETRQNILQSGVKEIQAMVTLNSVDGHMGSGHVPDLGGVETIHAPSSIEEKEEPIKELVPKPVPNLTMNIIMWNVRGANNNVFVPQSWDVIRAHKPLIFILLETKLDDCRAQQVMCILWFDQFEAIS